ncbi:hypothetical protein MNBD_NITROSPINAE01-112 [hydrothermal vent metagenome]|uniref:Uncharacterized protein n=1 Tax=hydrothermal vent metagenome TaxID=652676 RepID=A0A3B1CVD3_9ZZZZ
MAQSIEAYELALEVFTEKHALYFRRNTIHNMKIAFKIKAGLEKGTE